MPLKDRKKVMGTGLSAGTVVYEAKLAHTLVEENFRDPTVLLFSLL